MSTYKAYIKALNGFPVSDEGVSAYIGFKDRQMDVRFYEDIDEVPVSKYNVVIGYIDETIQYFKNMGQNLKYDCIPKSLYHEKYLSRQCKITTMADFRKGYHRLPIFIKPYENVKGFISGVMSKPETIGAFSDVPDDTKIFLSEVVNMKSEYRCYVIDNKVKGIHYYKGDIFTFPDPKKIKEMVEAYASTSPISYSLDVAVLNTGETVLVECNDGWCLGNYGLEHSIYCTLLLKRWIQMTNK